MYLTHCAHWGEVARFLSSNCHKLTQEKKHLCTAFLLWLIFRENYFHKVWLLPVLDISGLFHSFCYMSSLEIREAIYNFLCGWQKRKYQHLEFGAQNPLFLTIVRIRNIFFCFCKQLSHRIYSALNLVSPTSPWLSYIKEKTEWALSSILNSFSWSW